MALLLLAKGEPDKVVFPASGQDFTRRELCALLDCHTIKVIELSSEQLMVVDANPSLRDKPINYKATTMVLQSHGKEWVAHEMELYNKTVNLFPRTYPPGNILGDALICLGEQIGRHPRRYPPRS